MNVCLQLDMADYVVNDGYNSWDKYIQNTTYKNDDKHTQTLSYAKKLSQWRILFVNF